MPWLPPAEAAVAFGIKTSALRSRFASGTVERNAEGLYFVPDTPPPTAREPTLADIEHDDVGGHGADYVFDDNRDRYIFSLRSKANAGRPLVLAGDTVRQMVLAYSRDGGDATLNAIARSFGLHRQSVREILAALGKTHDSAPFTDEEIAKRTAEDLGEDLIRLKEEKVLRAAERAQWAETQKLATQARNLDRFVFSKIAPVIANLPPPSIANLTISPAPPQAPFTCVFGLTDAHFGAAGWAAEVGAENNRGIQRARALATTKRLIERVMRLGQPTRWLIPAGSDNFHADTDLGTTTKGTPLDTDGSLARIYVEGCMLYEEIIALLSAVAPVHVVCMPGNHDRVLSMMLTHWLATRYRSDERVTVDSPVTSRSYYLFGSSLVGFTHGDGTKDNNLPITMAVEAADAWGKSKQRLVLTGHLHTDRSNEFAGVRVIHMPCLATADRWHHRSGYTGNTKAIAAYCIDDEEGLIATLPVQPPDGL